VRAPVARRLTLAAALLLSTAPPVARAQIDCPDRAFMRSQEYRFTGPALFAAPVFEDLDGDGRADLAALAHGDLEPLLAVARNLGPNADGIIEWGPFTYEVLDPGATSIVGGDFDGDGHPDVAVTAPSYDRLWTFRGDGAGGFAVGVLTTCEAPATPLTAADLNGDGRSDVVAGWGPGEFVVMSWDGTRLTPVSWNWIGPSEGLGPIVVTDFDGDGLLDVVSRYGGSGLSVNTGAGVGPAGDVLFAPAVNVDLQIYPGYLLGGIGEFAMIDEDGDGIRDFVATGAFANSYGPPYVSGSGFLYAQANSSSGAWLGTFGTLWADYHDGIGHVASGPLGPGAPDELLFSDSQAIFNWAPWAAQDIYRATMSPCGPLALADVDGDGRVDIVARTEDGNGLEVALRGCAPHPDVPASPHPAGDWQAGGVELNAGTGPATSPWACADGADGLYVAWAQDDGAGKLDVLAVHLDPQGAPRPGWPAGGLPVASPTTVSRSVPHAVPDGAGGVFVAWSEPGPALRLQHLAADGNRVTGWPETGQLVPADGSGPSCAASSWGIAADDSGGVIVLAMAYQSRAWADRIRPDGVRAAGWPASGLTVLNDYSDSYGYSRIEGLDFATGLGTAIGARVTLAKGCWATTDGCLPPYGYTLFQMIGVDQGGNTHSDYSDASAMNGGWPDGRGAMLAWLGSRTITRLTFGGPGPWLNNATFEPLRGGDLVALPDFSVRVVGIEADDAAPVGALRLYLQALQSNGVHAPGWPADGRRLTWSGTGQQVAPRILAASDGSLLVFDLDDRSGAPAIYVMKLDTDGYPLPGWDFGGQPLVEGVGPIGRMKVVNGLGGAGYVVWTDSRGGASSVYAQRVGADLPVPVTFTALEPVVSPHEVRLDWLVHDAGSSDFTVERTEAAEWTAIASARPDGTEHLRVTDRDVRPGRSYGYRLRSGGTISPAAWVQVPSSSPLTLRVLGAPARSRGTRVRLQAPAAGTATLEWFDVAGRRLGSRSVRLEADTPIDVPLDEGHALPSGLLLIRLTAGGRSVRARAVVVN